MRNALIAVVVIIILGAGYYFYSQQSSTTQPVAAQPAAVDTSLQATTTDATTTASVATSTPVVKEFSITNKGFTFSQKELSVQKGDHVKITYTNGGGTHDFRVEGYDVGTKRLSAGQSETFEFDADKAGTFAFFCSVGNHRAMGMAGTLTVTE